uniref:Protein SNA4 n=1 Tax=Ascaris lumbricoides TaxID=6252 RepID=A0A0M3ISH8_ASCLU
MHCSDDRGDNSEFPFQACKSHPVEEVWIVETLSKKVPFCASCCLVPCERMQLPCVLQYSSPFSLRNSLNYTRRLVLLYEGRMKLSILLDHILPSMKHSSAAMVATMGSTDADKIVEVILIIFLPPLAVWYHARECNCHVCFNILLLFLFVIPSIIHAVWYCYMRDE